MEPSLPTGPNRAAVEHDEGRIYLAWCLPCQDGLRAPLPKAEAWAAQHNADRHQPEPTEGTAEAPC